MGLFVLHQHGPRDRQSPLLILFIYFSFTCHLFKIKLKHLTLPSSNLAVKRHCANLFGLCRLNGLSLEMKHYKGGFIN
jgi:hypothetical protein